MFIPIPIIFMFMAIYFSLIVKNDNDQSLCKKINKSVDDFSKLSTNKQLETIVKIIIGIIIYCIIFYGFIFIMVQTSKQIREMNYDLITKIQSRQRER